MQFLFNFHPFIRKYLIISASRKKRVFELSEKKGKVIKSAKSRCQNRIQEVRLHKKKIQTILILLCRPIYDIKETNYAKRSELQNITKKIIFQFFFYSRPFGRQHFKKNIFIFFPVLVYVLRGSKD